MSRLGEHSHRLVPGWQPVADCPACQSIEAGRVIRDSAGPVRKFNVVVTVIATVPALSAAEAVARLTAALRGHGFTAYVLDDEQAAGLAPFVASDDTEPTDLPSPCTDRAGAPTLIRPAASSDPAGGGS